MPGAHDDVPLLEEKHRGTKATNATRNYVSAIFDKLGVAERTARESPI